jgi:IS30 family transposase
MAFRYQIALQLQEAGCSYEEIAAQLGVAQNTVCIMLRRARLARRQQAAALAAAPAAAIEQLAAENARLRERLRIRELTDD